jgi:multicomponent Na+:H+ antiporter subunit B
MEQFINMVLLTLLALVTLGIIRVRNLFAVVVLTGAYSFIMASVMLVLDAVDVALTEAAVGAGVSMVLALGALYLTSTEEAPARYSPLLPLFVVIGTGAVLVWGTWGLPPFGQPDTPLNTGVGAEYLARTYEETKIPNVVTAVLASYRGFDTLGETVVIFTGGIGVLVLLRRFQKQG